ELLQLKQQCLELLDRHLADANPFVRASASKALGDLADPEAIPLLRRALSDADLDVRLFAVEALGGIRHPEASALL
ncbi:HEAT repeat domain-containing protein, partial [Bacteroides caccae]|uniref:HEAT repeat domain-containing protein n=1 Tax=Bacteroides caccae TaxID=47678 RepID=UPI001D05FCF0